MIMLVRFAFAMAFALSLSATGSAQGQYDPTIPTYVPRNPVQIVHDQPGNSIVVGHYGYDSFIDNIGNDADNQWDAPVGPDGSCDLLETYDGDNNDAMYGGREDSFIGDPGDMVFILRPFGQLGNWVLWSGTFEEYQRMQALLRYVQDWGYLCFKESGGDGGNPCGYWAETADFLAAAIPTVPEGTEIVVFADYCKLGPYEEGEVPETPADFLAWLPFAEEDPCEATAELKMTYDEYEAAVTGVLKLLDSLSQAACE